MADVVITQQIPGASAVPKFNPIAGPNTVSVQSQSLNECNASGGSITLNVAPNLTTLTQIAVKVLGSLSGNTVTVVPPAGKTIEQPGPPAGTYGASFVFSGPAYAGSVLSWYVDSNGNLSLSG